MYYYALIRYYNWLAKPPSENPTALNQALRVMYYAAIGVLMGFSVLVLATSAGVAASVCATTTLFACVLHVASLVAVDVNRGSGSEKRRNWLFIPVLMGPVVIMPILPLLFTALEEYGYHPTQDQMALLVLGFVPLVFLNLGAHRKWALRKLNLEK